MGPPVSCVMPREGGSVGHSVYIICGRPCIRVLFVLSFSACDSIQSKSLTKAE